ncbi:hypothetical protein [Olsenella uli]|uniref:hypothetical protein n=1 Tax=Olsenella uli TaxID=133926 RepID=UPI0028EA5B8D|nr:hypothetical protein [Olsenella uli]
MAADNNMFGSFAESRKSSQDRIEDSISTPKARQKRTHFTLSLSPEAKEKLKVYAFRQDKPISKIIEEWIERYAN